jgi:hypothetical protein
MAVRVAFWGFLGFVKFGGVPNWDLRGCGAG